MASGDPRVASVSLWLVSREAQKTHVTWTFTVRGFDFLFGLFA